MRYLPTITHVPGYGPRDHAAPELLAMATDELPADVSRGYETRGEALAVAKAALAAAYARGRTLAEQWPSQYGLLRGVPCRLVVDTTERIYPYILRRVQGEVDPVPAAYTWDGSGWVERGSQS